MGNLIVDIGNTAVEAAFTDAVIRGKRLRYQGEVVNDFILALMGVGNAEVMGIFLVYAIQPLEEGGYAAACGRLGSMDSAYG